ncbi:MAG: LPS export ABC transporter permease LptG, partial [Gammaproteobacteria bacterium]
WTSLLALFILIALFSFFTLIDELKDTGRGNYGVAEAVLYVILTVPRLAYELFPIAAVIGSMSVLGIMVRNHELDVIRTSGVSAMRLSLLMAKSSVLLVLFAVIIGEWVAPVSEERAQNLRSVALTEQITLRTRYGLWVRDANSYINIRRLLPGNRVEEIYFYEFNDRYNLRRSVHASSGVYADGEWLLENLRESVFNEAGVESRRQRQATWASLLDPDILDVATVRPQYLTIAELTRYIDYLGQNAQNTRLYEQALWAKLIKPFSIVAMIILAVPLVRGHSKFTAVGQRVFVGAMAGILFHLANQVSTNLGIVYQIHPMLSVVAPTLLLGLLIIYLVRD